MSKKNKLKQYFKNLSTKNIYIENSTVSMPAVSQQFPQRPRLRVAKADIQAENTEPTTTNSKILSAATPQAVMPQIQFNRPQNYVQPVRVNRPTRPMQTKPVQAKIKVKESSWFMRNFGKIFGCGVLISAGVTTSAVLATTTIPWTSIFSSITTFFSTFPILTWLPALVTAGVVGLFVVAQSLIKHSAKKRTKNNLQANTQFVSLSKQDEILKHLNKANRTGYYKLVSKFLESSQYDRKERFYGQNLAILNKYLGEDVVDALINGRRITNLPKNLDY